jgi:uncharacterized protein
MKTLLISSIAFIPLFIMKSNITGWIAHEAVSRPAATIVTSWSNMAFMLVLVSGFTLLFGTTSFHGVLNIFSCYGRMSLSNYVMQSVIGSSVYYGYGLGLYKHTGATYSLLIGLLLAVMQHSKGPLETLWHNATWVGIK